MRVRTKRVKRSVFCKYKVGVRCVGLVGGKQFCFVDESSEEQFNLTHELQFCFCSLFPESEKVKFIASCKESGVSIRRVWE